MRTLTSSGCSAVLVLGMSMSMSLVDRAAAAVTFPDASNVRYDTLGLNTADAIAHTNFTGGSMSFHSSTNINNWVITAQSVPAQAAAFTVTGIRSVVTSGSGTLSPYNFANQIVRSHITFWLGDTWPGLSSPVSALAGDFNYVENAQASDFTFLGIFGEAAGYDWGRDGLNFAVPANTTLWVSTWWERPGNTYNNTLLAMSFSSLSDGPIAYRASVGAFGTDPATTALTVVIPAPATALPLLGGFLVLSRRRR